MLEISAILASWKAQSGLLWTDLARACEVDVNTIGNWRKGILVPWEHTARRLAAFIGPVVGRSDLVDVIARDRAEIAKRRASRATLAEPRHPTPRTLVMPRDGDRGGAA